MVTVATHAALEPMGVNALLTQIVKVGIVLIPLIVMVFALQLGMVVLVLIARLVGIVHQDIVYVADVVMDQMDNNVMLIRIALAGTVLVPEAMGVVYVLMGPTDLGVIAIQIAKLATAFLIYVVDPEKA